MTITELLVEISKKKVDALKIARAHIGDMDNTVYHDAMEDYYRYDQIEIAINQILKEQNQQP